MNPNEWQLEMNRMLDSFANQAEFSLGKIDRCFETMGRPFDDDFRKYYLEMSNRRLDMSFKAVLFSKGPARDPHSNDNESSANNPSPAKEQSPNLLQSECDDDLIKIYDSDDGSHFETRPDENTYGMQNGEDLPDCSEAKPFVQAEPNLAIDSDYSHIEMNKNTGASQKQSGRENNRNDSRFGGADLGDEYEVKPFIKEESKADNAIEMVDIPLIRFDPNNYIDSTVAVNEKSEEREVHKTGSSSNRKRNQSNCIVSGKRFKCEHCDKSYQANWELKRHERVHANGKLIGVKADSSGLYHCSHCVRRFVDVGHLSHHMKSHDGNQHLYYCTRCMRQFERLAAKDRHANECKGRYYECHLCKVFVNRYKSPLQRHMQKHSGTN